MTTLKIENRPLPDSQYTLTYRDEYGIQTIESGVKKDDNLVGVRKYKEGGELGEQQVLSANQSTLLFPGERVEVLPSSSGVRGAFILEAVEEEQRMIVDGVKQVGPLTRTTINGVTITQAND